MKSTTGSLPRGGAGDHTAGHHDNNLHEMEMTTLSVIWALVPTCQSPARSHQKCNLATRLHFWWDLAENPKVLRIKANPRPSVSYLLLSAQYVLWHIFFYKDSVEMFVYLYFTKKVLYVLHWTSLLLLRQIEFPFRDQWINSGTTTKKFLTPKALMIY